MKFKRNYGGAYGEVWWSVGSVRVWSQSVDFVLVRLAVALKLFSHLI
jgi:hypothetical protein